MHLFGRAANLYADSGAAAEPEVEQHEVGQLLLQHAPIFRLVAGCAYNLGFRYLVADNTFRSLQLEGDVFYDNHFKVFHTLSEEVLC